MDFQWTFLEKIDAILRIVPKIPTNMPMDFSKSILPLIASNSLITKENMDENHGNWYYEMKELGFNYRLTDFQSALGITQLAKNNKVVVRRNEISATYKKAFEGKIKFQDLPSGMYNAHHLFIVQVENRKEFYDFLHSKGILAQIHYVPVHTMPYYKKIISRIIAFV